MSSKQTTVGPDSKKSKEAPDAEKKKKMPDEDWEEILQPIFASLDDTDRRTAEDGRNFKRISDGFYEFVFDWSDGTVQEACLQRFRKNWFVMPRRSAPVAEHLVVKAWETMRDHIVEELCADEQDEDPELQLLVPIALMFPTLRDECGILHRFPTMAFTFACPFTGDHGLWSGVSEDGQRAEAASFN